MNAGIFVIVANEKHSFISFFPHLYISPNSRLNKKVEEECPVDDTLDKVAAKEEKRRKSVTSLKYIDLLNVVAF